MTHISYVITKQDISGGKIVHIWTHERQVASYKNIALNDIVVNFKYRTAKLIDLLVFINFDTVMH